MHVVFSDIEMPGTIDGFGLARWIRQHGLDVLLTGTIPRAVEMAKELCEQGSLPRPYEAQTVTTGFVVCSRRARQEPNSAKLRHRVQLTRAMRLTLSYNRRV